jgi:hypothetical protein
VLAAYAEATDWWESDTSGAFEDWALLEAEEFAPLHAVSTRTPVSSEIRFDLCD